MLIDLVSRELHGLILKGNDFIRIGYDKNCLLPYVLIRSRRELFPLSSDQYRS
jgi:hypothetical protein